MEFLFLSEMVLLFAQPWLSIHILNYNMDKHKFLFGFFYDLQIYIY